MITSTKKMKSGRTVYICHFRGVDFVSLDGHSAAMTMAFRAWHWDSKAKGVQS